MKQSSTSVVVMSDAERRERLRNRIYAVFPVVSVLLLILLWFLAAGAENSTFPSPVDIWNRFLLLMEKPIKQLNLFGHIWASLLRVFIALAFAWLLGISFGILIGWNKKANALLGPLFTAFRSVPPLAWVPLMTMWFGTGEFPKILIVFIGALMPVVVSTWSMDTVKAVAWLSVFTFTICSSPSRSAISALMGVQISPLAWVAMKLTFSVVASWAAQIRSPSFSRSGSSMGHSSLFKIRFPSKIPRRGRPWGRRAPPGAAASPHTCR